jgi:DNA-binding transcriptional LysR family regulator
MDRLDAMSVLLAVVETGSLSAASRQIGMPLATVSRRISELEGYLGTRLINRSSRRIALTEAGHSYVESCRRILEQVTEAEQAAQGEFRVPRGHLVITTPVVFGRLHVLPIVVEFLKMYPEISIRIVQMDRVINLLEEHVDLAVRIAELPDSSLVARRVGEIRRVLCASPAYFAQRGGPKRPEDLSNHDCVTFENLASSTIWTFRDGQSEVSVPVSSRLVVNTAEAAIDAAIAGGGITRVLSYQIADAIAAGTLVTCLETFELKPWPVSLVHTGQGPLPLKLRTFLDFATPRLKAKLTGR